MTTFNKLILYNYMAFKEATIPLDEPGLILIKGENNTNDCYVSNGSGKSSLYEGLLWCCWGQTVREYKHDDVVNDKFGKDCMVITMLTDNTGKKWMIRRTRKHTDFKNSVALCEGHVWDEKKEWNDEVKVQAKIDAILGLDFKAFTQTFVFHKEGKKVTPFPIMSDSEQKALLERLYDLEKWSVLEDLANKRVSVGKAKKKELEDKNTQLNHTLEYIEKENAQLTSQEADYEDKIKSKVRDLREELAELEEEESDYDIVKIKKSLKKQQALVKDFKEINNEDALEKLVDKRDEYKEHISNANHELKTLKAVVKKAEDEIETFEEDLEGECPTCKQIVDAKHCKDHIKKLNKEIAESRLGLLSNESIISSATDTVEETEAEIKELKRATREREEEKDDCQTKITSLTNKLSKAESAETAKEDKIKDYKKRIKETKDSLSSNPYAELRAQKKKEGEEQSKLIEDTNKRLGKVDNKLEHLTFLEKSFSRSGIPSFLLDDIIPELNNSAQHYSNILTGGTIDIEFSNQTTLKSKEVREKFEVRVTNESGANSYKGDSSGEKKRIDLCVLFALQKVAMLRSKNNFNLLFMDEIFDSLDTSGVEQAIALLEEELETHPTIFVISHNTELTSFFDNTITVVKDDGLSSIK